MTTYARLRVSLEVGESADYLVNRGVHIHEDTWSSSDEARIRDVIECAVAGTSYSISHLASVDFVLIENLDTTNYITVVYRTGGGAAVDQTMVIQPGECVLLQDVTVATALTITADTAAVRCAISYLGT